jgi:hypothetical protein
MFGHGGFSVKYVFAMEVLLGVSAWGQMKEDPKPTCPTGQIAVQDKMNTTQPPTMGWDCVPEISAASDAKTKTEKDLETLDKMLACKYGVIGDLNSDVWHCLPKPLPKKKHVKLVCDSKAGCIYVPADTIIRNNVLAAKKKAVSKTEALAKKNGYQHVTGNLYVKP